MKDKLAIFDLDGTLFDTGEVNYRAYKDALQPFGVDLDRAHYIDDCNGRHYTEFLPEIMGTSMYNEEVHRLKKAAYSRNLAYARENTHLFNLLCLLRRDYHTAIVTTASRKNTMEILTHFHREALFDLILTQEDMTRMKPDPEGFILAMRHFDMSADDTVIFEDSEPGILAAKATGATVIAIMKF